MIIKLFYVVFFSFAIVSSAPAIESEEAVVKLFVTTNPMDDYRPWQSVGIQSTSGSGTILEGQHILTNAHVVSDHTFIQIKKNNDPKKYTARVIAMGYDCDLALLKVDDPNFFEGTKELKMGDLPNLQDTVTVVGYPAGGEKLSITEGVVSRIELSSYSASVRKLLAIQIDAAINPGNSGGPVIKDGKLVGIAMQVFQSGQNIGYMIPIPIIKHFFKDLEDKRYDGFPMVGINYMTTESPSLRKFYGLENVEGGVFVSSLLPFAPAHSQLKDQDVVLEIDGVPIGEDGTFSFRNNERLAMPHLITEKQINEKIQFKVIRDKKVVDLSVDLYAFKPLVPNPHYFEKPPYYIFGGMVFTVLSSDLLRSWGKDWWEKGPIDFNYFLLGTGTLNPDLKEDIVVLLNVLPDDINVGYHDFGNNIITSVNDVKFFSFKEFVLLLDKVKNSEAYTIIETDQRLRIILNNENIEQINAQILERNNIPVQSSPDVAGWLNADPQSVAIHEQFQGDEGTHKLF